MNNYLAGRTPPAFDILFWNADTTRMSAALHRDFVTAALDNALTRPGATTMLGTPVDLGAVTVDTYVVAGQRRPHLPVAQLLPQHSAARRRPAGSCCPPAATSPR